MESPLERNDLSMMGVQEESSSMNSRKVSSTSSTFLLSPGKLSEEGQSQSSCDVLSNSRNSSKVSKVPKVSVMEWRLNDFFIQSFIAFSLQFCEVCSDKAKSFHFGGLACDSCKAFFRRSVHNDAYTAFRCSYEGTCHITKNTRKSCQKCRFEKCLSIGMEKNWVMSEEERNVFNQQR
jgi:hypothetical protein